MSWRHFTGFLLAVKCGFVSCFWTMDDLKDFLRDFWERDFWDTTLFSIPFLLGLLSFEIFWWFFLPSILENFYRAGVFVRTCKFLFGVWLLRLFVWAGFSVLGIVYFFFPEALSPWLPDWLFDDE